MAIDREDPCTLYWREANQAIAEGLITRLEATVIAQVGTRKQGYWGDHLTKLRKYLDHRREQQACLQTTM